MAIKLPNKLLHYKPLDNWDEKQARIKLLELYDGALSLADNTIAWYHSYRTRKGKWSKSIRIVSIMLLIASTLMPFFASIVKEELTILYIGYIMAGIGGGLLLLDRYYGYSNSWVRFVLTGMDLENMRNTFVENWQVNYLNNLPLTIQSFGLQVDSIIKFQEVFNGAVKAETETWAKEFQQSFKDLVAALKAQSDQLKANIEEEKSIAEANRKNNASEDIQKNVTVDVVREAIDRNFDEWKKIFNTSAISSGEKITGGEQTDINCIVFIPEQKLDQGARLFTPIPSMIRFRSVNGHTYNIPTDVRAGGSEIISSGKPALICDNTRPKRPGCSISRITSGNDTGTLGLKVFKDGKPYLLSCYHVLCAPELAAGQEVFDSNKAVGGTTIVSPGRDDADDGMELGNVVEGELNDEVDCAIALLNDTLDVTSKLCSINKPPALPLTVTEDHAKARYPVKSVARTSGIIEGTIQFAYTHCDINYGIGGKRQLKTLRGVICTSQLSDGGDSGAPVVDKDNNIIGIIIACSREFTYIIPIQRILAKFSITINNQ
jgi:SMODS and SLOG-associating 2TM effector domain 2